MLSSIIKKTKAKSKRIGAPIEKAWQGGSKLTTSITPTATNSSSNNHTIPTTFVASITNAVDKLLIHPRTVHEVSQDPDTFAFIWRPQVTPGANDGSKEQRFGGVLKFLQQRLYPTYRPPLRRLNEQSSRAQGERVHRHLSHAINCVADKQCSCEGCKRPVNSTVMNKHTRSLLSTLKHLRITPRRCEVPIVSQQWQVGTRIDLIGVKNDGRSVLVSIKTGYDKHFNRRHDKSANLQAPLQEWPDTPLSHHRAQLLAEYLICKHEYGVVFDECIILYAAKQSLASASSMSSDESVHVELLPNLARYGTMQIYQAIGNIANKN